MSYTLGNLKDDVNRKLHNEIGKVGNFYDLAYEAARNLLAQTDPPETVRRALISQAIYDNIYDYTAPSRLKEDAVINIFPQVNANVTHNPSQALMERFALDPKENQFVVEYRNGVKVLRFKGRGLNQPTVVNTLDSTTSDGTWAVGDDGANAATDNLYYVSGSGSVKFDLDGSTTAGYIENSTMSQKDLSSMEDIGAFFTWFYIPDSSLITQVTLRWGNDSSNYWADTITSGHFDGFQDGWNLLRFDWNGAVEIGAPAATTVDYTRFTVTYDGTADTDYRLDNIVASNGTLFWIQFYSDYIFTDSSGAYVERPSALSDLVILEPSSINLLVYECAVLGAMEIAGEDGSFDWQSLDAKLNGKGNDAGMYRQFRKRNPSQREKKSVMYYGK